MLKKGKGKNVKYLQKKILNFERHFICTSQLINIYNLINFIIGFFDMFFDMPKAWLVISYATPVYILYSKFQTLQIPSPNCTKNVPGTPVLLATHTYPLSYSFSHVAFGCRFS